MIEVIRKSTTFKTSRLEAEIIDKFLDFLKEEAYLEDASFNDLIEDFKIPDIGKKKHCGNYYDVEIFV